MILKATGLKCVSFMLKDEDAITLETCEEGDIKNHDKIHTVMATNMGGKRSFS